MSRGSSRLRMRLPTSFSTFVIVLAISVSATRLLTRRCRRGSDRVDDVLVPGAPAQIAFNAMTDLVVSRVRVAVQNLLGRHDHARRAETALRAVLVPEGLLHPVQLPVFGQDRKSTRLNSSHMSISYAVF